MPLDTTIQEIVESAVKAEKMFTSVDIANTIKLKGIWIRNREVRNWMREAFSTPSRFPDYMISQILVCNDTTLASLYHPVWLDPSDYNDRDQKALTPVQVRNIQKQLAGSDKDDSVPDINDVLNKDDNSDDDSNNDDLSIIIKSVDRIKIPGVIIRKLGWEPGDTIDPASIMSHRVIPSTLTVNSDYRVSIPRSAINWGTDPVKVMYQKGKVVFEKA